MIDPALLRGDLEAAAKNMARRGFRLDVNGFTTLDLALRKLRQQEESLRGQRNRLSKKIGVLKRDGKQGETQQLQSAAGAIGDEIQQLHGKVNEVQLQFNDFMLSLPNLLDREVPQGKSEDDNVLLREVGVPTKHDFAARDHVALGELHGLMDFAVASRMSQSRFVVLVASFSRLHRALGQFMLDLHVAKHGYSEHYVPYLVNTVALTNTGQLPKFGAADEFFSAKADDLHLIPTAEVSLANLAANRAFAEDELPCKFVAHTPCFRREAGSYGKDTRGMLRQHQFDKVELVQVTHPDVSAIALEELTSHAEKVLQELELPYRVMELCTGDIGNAAARTFDLEVWLPGQAAYREISSCSNDRDFQARRMNARVHSPDKSNPHVHLLNGSGVAVGRALIAVLENNQMEDGSIRVPKALHRYFPQEVIKAPA